MTIENPVSNGDDARNTRTSGSLRDLVLEAGVEVLGLDGLGLRPESISYAKVFAYLDQEHDVRVTRGSVHERIWVDHDSFRRDVMAAALQQLPLDVPLRIALSKPENMAEFVGGVMSKPNPLRHFSWVLAQSIWDRSWPSEVADLTLSLKAIASRFNDPLTAEVLRDELEARDSQRMATRPKVLLLAVKRLGRRIKPEFGMSEAEGARLAYLLLDTLVLGSYLNARAGCSDLSTLSPHRPDGEDDDRPWSTAAIAALALFELVTEVDPDAQPFSAAPANEAAPSGDPLKVLEHRASMEVALDDLQAARSAAGDSKIGQRRSRDELRQLVLTAGQELFLRDGLALQPEALRYSAVLGHLRQQHGVVVNRASLHGRIWDNHKDFCLDVIAHSLSRLEPVEPPKNRGDGDGGGSPMSAEDARRFLLDRTREGMLLRVQQMSDSGQYRQRLLVKAALVDNDGSVAMDNLCEVMRRTDTERIEQHGAVLTKVLDSLGFEVKSELGLTSDEATELTVQISQFVAIGSVFNELCRIDSGMRTFPIARGDGSGLADEWNLTGLAVRACVQYFFRHRSESA